MKECRECELAIYCYSDSSTWIFRTKLEMEEKTDMIAKCSIYQELQSQKADTSQSAALRPL
jgi:hypothetical protein